MIGGATPSEVLVVEIRAHGYCARLRAEVAYVDSVAGFAVRFVETDPAALEQLDLILQKGPERGSL